MDPGVVAGPLLALETSTSIGSVAVGGPGELLAEIVFGGASRHAETLLPAIDAALGMAGVERESLAGVVVAGGPGSFTGVRIAGATAKGLVRSLGLPLFAYPGLTALAAAAGVGSLSRTVAALFDARRGEVYAAAYRFSGPERLEPVLEPVVLHLETVLERLGGDVLYVGEGATRYRDRIEAAGGLVAPAELAVPRASALLWLAGVDPAGGRVGDPAAWEPAYLRRSGAERGVRG